MLASIRTIWRLGHGHRGRYGLALACLLAANALNYCVPLVGSAAIDAAAGGRGPSRAPAAVALLVRAFGGASGLRARLWLAPVAMVGVAALAAGFSVLKSWQAALASDGIAQGVRLRLYDHLNHLPVRRHDEASTGDLLQRCTTEVEAVRRFFGSQVLEVCNCLVLIGLSVPMMLMLNGPMTLVSLSLTGPLVAYCYFYLRKMRGLFRAADEAEGALTAHVQENVTGIRVVRAMGRHAFERRKFAALNGRFRERKLRLRRSNAWYMGVSYSFVLAQTGTTLVFGAREIAVGRISVGVLFVFLSYLALMLNPIRQLGRVLTELGRASVAVARIEAVLGMERESVEPPGVPARSQGIVVRDLCFGHRPGERVLDGLSFEVRPGETFAILGPSGSGKTTLVQLLLRMYDYSEGSIRFGGAELSRLPRKWVRSQIGLVSQEPFLFSKSVAENLRLGRPGAGAGEVEQAARAAALHEAVTGFERGYETAVGERGVTLSGGQRQRLALARALLRDSPVLILDDALSAVDADTEAEILGALERRRGRSTTILVAHRLSTLARADRVMVLNRGRAAQIGSPAELRERDGLYRRLWEIHQAAARHN